MGGLGFEEESRGRNLNKKKKPFKLFNSTNALKQRNENSFRQFNKHLADNYKFILFWPNRLKPPQEIQQTLNLGYRSKLLRSVCSSLAQEFN